MISAFSNIWKISELRNRILFTLAMIVVVRLGVAITIPGVDSGVIKEWLAEVSSGKESQGAGQQLGALLNVFSGGALQKLGVFALGVMPYISASIMMQLMSAVIPKLAKLRREDGGQQKINQYTRFITIGIATVQGSLLARSLANPGSIPYMGKIEDFGVLVPGYGTPFVLMTVLILVAGTMLLMWIGDQITDRGVGNGVSLIIAANIISSLPGAFNQAWVRFVVTGGDNQFRPMILVGLIAFLLFVIAAVIAITQGQRRIAVQYAKRIVGRKQYGGQTQYLPLKVNYANVMPIIFASAILTLPQVIFSQWFQKNAVLTKISNYLQPPELTFYLVAGAMIFFFSYFWVATMFQPSQIAEDLKKNGGYIPGIRPGKPTADFLDYTMTRLTFAGSIFLTIVFILPSILTVSLQLPGLVTQFFGGTSLLILVGVLLDMMRQVETHLLQRHYDGFLRKGKTRSRYQQGGKSGADVRSNGKMVYLWAFIAFLIVVGIAIFVSKG